MSDASKRLTAAIAGRFTIERELGSGGMATVYLAHDGMLVAASVAAGSTFRITARQPLFSASTYQSDNRHRA